MAITLPEQPAPALRIRLFGPFEVQVNGEPLPRLRSRKVRSLFALLTLRASAAIERTRVAGLLWPESPESTVLANLRRDLVDLRQALGPALDGATPRRSDATSKEFSPKGRHEHG